MHVEGEGLEKTTRKGGTCDQGKEMGRNKGRGTREEERGRDKQEMEGRRERREGRRKTNEQQSSSKHSRIFTELEEAKIQETTF